VQAICLLLLRSPLLLLLLLLQATSPTLWSLTRAAPRLRCAVRPPVRCVPCCWCRRCRRHWQHHQVGALLAVVAVGVKNCHVPSSGPTKFHGEVLGHWLLYLRHASFLYTFTAPAQTSQPHCAQSRKNSAKPPHCAVPKLCCLRCRPGHLRQ
jgi:hypothetical protein